MFNGDSQETSRPPLYDGPCTTAISNSHSTVEFTTQRFGDAPIGVLFIDTVFFTLWQKVDLNVGVCQVDDSVYKLGERSHFSASELVRLCR